MKVDKELIEHVASLARLKLTDKEINKFLAISRNIKEKDFEMTHFARQLREGDREKLELMRKVDTMERLVSRMRRTV